jgi:hypothetical protein
MPATLETLYAALGDHTANLRFERIAEKISGNPALLDIALANISRWLAQGHSARERLEGWRSRLLAARQSAAGLQSLIALLRDPSAEAEEWRTFSPFAGVLTRDELDGLRWTSRH